jgi:hypothetical protein
MEYGNSRAWKVSMAPYCTILKHCTAMGLADTAKVIESLPGIDQTPREAAKATGMIASLRILARCTPAIPPSNLAAILLNRIQ